MATDPQTRALARKVASLERAILALKQPSLANSGIEGGALQAQDDYGNQTMIIGAQHDGTNTAAVVVGPPPPKPQIPHLIAVPGGMRVYWDGTFADGSVAPMDFARVLVYAKPQSSYTGPEPLNQAIIIGQFTSATGGECITAIDPGISYAFYFHCWSQAGRYSVSSDVALGTAPSQATGADLAMKSTVYKQDAAPWPDGDPTHATTNIGDLWYNTTPGPGKLWNILSYSVASNVVTLTADTDHDMSAGATLVTVTGFADPDFDDTFTIASVPTTTSITIALTKADQATKFVLGAKMRGLDVKPLNKASIWDGTAWRSVQDSDVDNATGLDEGLLNAQDSLATLALTATDAFNTAYAADGRVSISDYEPTPNDIYQLDSTGQPAVDGDGNPIFKNDGSLWITRTRDRLNQVVNPSFEGGLAGWAAVGLSAISNPTASPAAPDGTLVARVTNDATNPNLHYIWSYFLNVPGAGVPVTISSHARGISGPYTQFRTRAVFMDASLTTVYGDVYGDYVPLGTDWARSFVSAITPPGTGAVLYSVEGGIADVGAVWEIDAVLGEFSSKVGRYFDGGSEGGSWTGLPELSTSHLDGNAIMRLFTLEDSAWTEKFWTADTIKSVNVKALRSALGYTRPVGLADTDLDGGLIGDNTIPVDKAFTPTATAGENLTAGNLVHVVSEGGIARVYKADCNSTPLRRAVGFVLDTVSTGAAVKVYKDGYNPLMTGLTPGPQWLDAVAGRCVSAPPVIAGTIVQRVGFATDANTLVFQPDTVVNIV